MGRYTFHGFLLVVICCFLPSISAARDNVIVHNITDCLNFTNALGDLSLKYSYDFYNTTVKAVSASVDLKVNFDKSFQGQLEFQKPKPGGGWRPNFFSFKEGNACKTLVQFLGPLWVGIASQAGVKDASKCPYVPGKYHLQNYVPTLRVPLMGYKGMWKLIVHVTRFEKTQACVVAIVSLI